MSEFLVINTETGEEPTDKELMNEDWVKGHLCNIDSFAITMLGDLVLCDSCGRFVFCSERYKYHFKPAAYNIDNIKST